MRSLLLIVALSVVTACGGAASVPPAARAPNPSALVAPPPAAEPAPALPSAPTDAEGAARAFLDAIATHDGAAAARVSDEDFGRGQVRQYAAVSAATLEGPGKSEDWPHLDASLFWGRVATDGAAKSERVLLAVEKKASGWKVIGLRDQRMRDETAAAAAVRAAPPSADSQSESRGQLLTKPRKGSLTVTLDAGSPSVGDKAQLSQRIDPSVPFVGGAWLAIADTEVTATSGKKVTLKVLAEKAPMMVNGKKLDHFTPGVPIILKWSSTDPG